MQQCHKMALPCSTPAVAKHEMKQWSTLDGYSTHHSPCQKMMWCEADNCHFFNPQFGSSVTDLKKCLFKDIWILCGCPSHMYKPGLCFIVCCTLISKPATYVFPCSGKGLEEVHPAKNTVPKLLLDSRIQKQTQTWRQQMKPQKLVMLMLSMKFSKLQMSAAKFLWQIGAQVGNIFPSIFPTFFPAQAMAWGGAGCEMSPHHIVAEQCISLSTFCSL